MDHSSWPVGVKPSHVTSGTSSAIHSPDRSSRSGALSMRAVRSSPACRSVDGGDLLVVEALAQQCRVVAGAGPDL